MPPPVLEFWFSALAEPVGIIVMTDNRERLLNQLYQARSIYRREQQSDELDGLSICLSPTSDSELWIIHKTVRVLNESGETKVENAEG